MTCPAISRDELWLWVHGETDDRAAAERISSHVADCVQCKSSADEMAALVADLRGLSGDDANASRAAPEQIGAYRILGQLGEGGMGVVYEAEQQSPQRRVALKVVRTGRAVDAFQTQLFEREMQTLARLNHPAIAAIYDAGRSAAGERYFAMELVEGQTLSAYLQSPTGMRLGIRQRLELFHAICDAVLHAHQRGVIHRDLKPSNIMLTAEGRVKVLDFGLARVTESDVSAVTMISETGRLLGTLQYMSPEQARGDVDAIDVRSDVYALGVILYELLTGTLPHDTSAVPLHEALATICSSQPISPRVLNEATPRDVATIVLKALEKEAARRYQTVAALADDVERFLTHHPIRARRASRGYRFRKLVQRHTLASGLIASLLVLATGAAIVFGVQAQTIAAERDRVQREARKAQAINAFLQDMLASSDPEVTLGRTLTVRQAVDEAARTIDTELREAPELEAAVRDTLGQVYTALGDYTQAEAHLRRALTLRRELHGGDHAEIAATLTHLAETTFHLARDAEALDVTEMAYAMRKRLFGEQHTAVAESLQDLGSLAWARGEFELARKHLRATLAMRRAVLPPGDDAIAEVLVLLGSLAQEFGEYDEAEALLREAVALRRAHLADVHPKLMFAVASLANVLRDTNQFDEAEVLYEEALSAYRQVYGDRHPAVALRLRDLGQLYFAQGRLAEAETRFAEALELAEAAYGHVHPEVAARINNLAVVAFMRGDAEQAEALFKDALAIKRAHYGDVHFEVAADLNNLGRLRHEAGDHAAAEAYFVEALRIGQQLVDGDHVAISDYLHNVANVYKDQGRLEEARRMHEQALAMRERLFGHEHLLVARSLESLAHTLCWLESYDQALAHAEDSRLIRAKLLGADDWSTAAANRVAARALIGLERYADAETRLKRNYALQREQLGAAHRETSATADTLLLLYVEWNRPQARAAFEAQRAADLADAAQ